MDKKNLIKVPGFTKKTTVGNNIEYRNFATNAVGTQLPKGEDRPSFSLGNFVITKNEDEREVKSFNTGKFSRFYTIDDLNLTVEELKTESNIDIDKRYDNTDIRNLALFSSLNDRFQNLIKHIVIFYPAEFNIVNNNLDSTILDYNYDDINDETNITFSYLSIYNMYNITITNSINDELLDEIPTTRNELRNFYKNFTNYELIHNNKKYQILDYSTDKNYNLIFKFKGKVPLITNFIASVRPKNKYIEDFYKNIPTIGKYMLDRDNDFKFKIYELDNNYNANVIELQFGLDKYGYNIDLTTKLSQLLKRLLPIFSSYDEEITNILRRKLVTNAVIEFDTEGKDDNDYGKIYKLLTIWADNFDNITKDINYIKSVNNITYNKIGNLPDSLLKNKANSFGWDVISPSDIENKLPSDNIVNKLNGKLTTVNEIENEFWRQLVINSAYIFRSKGTRKIIDYMIKLLGLPKDLIKFNEYVYQVQNTLDSDKITDILNKLNNDLTVEDLKLDIYGYPEVKPDTEDIYFQSKGGWWRETSGNNSAIDLDNAQNPHIGIYDNGGTFIKQFQNIIPNFEPTTITEEKLIINEDIVLNQDFNYCQTVSEEDLMVYYIIIEDSQYSSNYLDKLKPELESFIYKIKRRYGNLFRVSIVSTTIKSSHSIENINDTADQVYVHLFPTNDLNLFSNKLYKLKNSGGYNQTSSWRNAANYLINNGTIPLTSLNNKDNYITNDLELETINLSEGNKKLFYPNSDKVTMVFTSELPDGDDFNDIYDNIENITLETQGTENFVFNCGDINTDFYDIIIDNNSPVNNTWNTLNNGATIIYDANLSDVNGLSTDLIRENFDKIYFSGLYNIDQNYNRNDINTLQTKYLYTPYTMNNLPVDVNDNPINSSGIVNLFTTSRYGEVYENKNARLDPEKCCCVVDECDRDLSFNITGIIDNVNDTLCDYFKTLYQNDFNVENKLILNNEYEIIENYDYVYFVKNYKLCIN